MFYIINGLYEMSGPFEEREVAFAKARELEELIGKLGVAARAEVMIEAIESEVAGRLLSAAMQSPGGMVCVAEFVGPRHPVEEHESYSLVGPAEFELELEYLRGRVAEEGL